MGERVVGLWGAMMKTSNGTTVEATDLVRDIDKVKELATHGVNDVDMDKVEKLKRLIDNDEYEIDDQAIADCMVDEHLMFSS